MQKFAGKKLLILGSNVGTLDIIRYARMHGACTVVADYLPPDKSIGKQYSDEDVLISTGDLDGLKEYVSKAGIDGIIAGISEFNLLNAMELCSDFNLPFYCTRKQWDQVENKENFRKLCLEYGVPCPDTYFIGSVLPEGLASSVQSPVIVKPVDASASVGVSICRTSDELDAAFKLAQEYSKSGCVIIEEFFEGEEFSAHYSIADREVALCCVDNRIPVAVHPGDVTTVPIARIYPSSFTDVFISTVNDRLKSMIGSLGLETGVVFVQGLYDRVRGRFCIFEAGLRCAGEAPYRFIGHVNGVSFMDNLVDHALLGKTVGYDISKEDPFLKGKHCCVTSFVSRGGLIGKISGYEGIAEKFPSVLSSELRYHEGDATPDGNTLRQIVARFVLACDSREEMIHDVCRINEYVKILGVEGEDLCYRFDIEDYFKSKIN